MSERVCVDCAKSIEDRGPNSVRCVPCARLAKLEGERFRYRMLKERAAAGTARYCECGANISDRDPTAKYCLPCVRRRVDALNVEHRLERNRHQSPVRVRHYVRHPNR